MRKSSAEANLMRFKGRFYNMLNCDADKMELCQILEAITGIAANKHFNKYSRYHIEVLFGACIASGARSRMFAEDLGRKMQKLAEVNRELTNNQQMNIPFVYHK